MAETTPGTSPCACGQVIFDLTSRKKGELLQCTFCNQKYRYAGDCKITQLSAEEARLATIGAKPVAKKRASANLNGPPGGVMPMIGFIVGFNALAFVALGFLLPKSEDGLRHAAWDAAWTVSGKSIWPDAGALLLGHVIGFAAWAVFAFCVYSAMKRKAT